MNRKQVFQNLYCNLQRFGITFNGLLCNKREINYQRLFHSIPRNHIVETNFHGRNAVISVCICLKPQCSHEGSRKSLAKTTRINSRDLYVYSRNNFCFCIFHMLSAFRVLFKIIKMTHGMHTSLQNIL